MNVSVSAALLAACAAVPGVYAAQKAPATEPTVKYAYAALVNGRNAAAIKQYTLAIESRKLPVETLARSLLNRALAFQKTGNYKAAIDDYTAAMNLDALSAKMRAVALYNRGLAHHKAANPVMAIEDFTSALLLMPNFAQAYYSRANVLRENKQYLFAISDYAKARAHKHPAPHYTLLGEALTYEALNQKTRAKALLLKAVAIKPGFAAARTKLAAMSTAPDLPKKTANAPVPKLKIISYTPPKTLVTGSITKGPDLEITKTTLPKPATVPQKLTGAAQTVKMPPLPKVNALAKNKKPETRKVAAKTPAAKQPQSKPAPQLVGWTIQLTSQRDSESAWDVWKNLTARHKGLLKGQSATVVKAVVGTRGTFYRLRIHKIDSKQRAQNLCSRLKRRGTSCFVTRA